jgi:protein arginine kinase
LFQVSNQSTLGQSEQEIVDGLLGVAQKLVEYERHGQETLLAEARSQVEDKVWRALGLLSNARVLSSQEFMNLLSAVRLGISLSLISGLPTRFVNQLMIVTQPAHLQAEAGQRLEPDERDFRRATIVRRKLEEADAHGEERPS